MKKAGRFLVLLATIMMLAGCFSGQNPESESQPETSEPESSVPQFSVSEEETASAREPSDMTVAEMRESEVESHLSGLEPEMETEGVLWYTGNQKVFFRDIALDSGDTRNLTGILTTDENWDHSLSVTVADSSPEGYVYLPYLEVRTDGLDYIRDEEGSLTVPEVWQIEWLDQRYFYISSPANIGIFDSDTGALVSASRDAWEIYAQATGLDRSYLQPVNEVYTTNGKAYYTGFRDPELLNTNGSLFELGLSGERLLTDDAMYVVGTAENAVVFLRTIPGKDDQTSSADGLCFYDLKTEEVVGIFTDVFYELDEKYNTVGGQVLGNEWAGKQWNYDHPSFVMEDGAVLFYLSRIADGEVDRYRYDLSARTLQNLGAIAQAPEDTP
ncbi:MAG TPA: hypothetical protein PKY19_01270 [Oscillospiraceae bacterium]|nr:hypothetical protein [Oscillospiraceae bacterium]